MFCECRNLTVRRGPALVLDMERLGIRAGRITAVVGPNGAGKTTLLEVLALLRRPTSGQLKLWGRPASPDDRELRRKVVMVMHPGYMFRGSVWRNLMYGLKARGLRGKEARSRAAEALKMVALAGFAHRHAADLSAGERQRVNLARALAIGPEAILLDEPAANVDTRTVEVVRELLTRLRDDRNVTIIHTSPGDSQLRAIADQVVRLEAGKVQQADEQAETD